MALNKKNIIDKSQFVSYDIPKHQRCVISESFDWELILRIIDANLNRCREGLRVVEDSLRFVLNDGELYKKIRAIRHKADKVLRNKYGDIITERDSFDDSGREMPEVSKKSLHEIVIANFKRAQESLRVLEEYSKIFIPEASADFKKQRYAVYIVEKEVYLKFRKKFKMPPISTVDDPKKGKNEENIKMDKI